jgi:rhamnosyltransferase
LNSPKIYAVVVTYFPDDAVVANLRALQPQVARVVIVDNTGPHGSRSRLDVFRVEGEVTVILNADNRGLAAALNQGLVLAAAEGADWIATFDQDSRAPDGYCAGLLAGFAACPEPAHVGMLAPIYQDHSLGFRYSPAASLEGDARPVAPVTVAITSGNLLRADAVRAVGGFREDFIIDCVDFEYCLRLRRGGWTIYEIRDVVLDHAQGNYTKRTLLGRQFSVNDYPPVRRYYQTRNRWVTYRLHASVAPGWILRDAWIYAKEMVKLGLFSRDRRAKLAAVATGAWHGLTGRLGAWKPR